MYVGLREHEVRSNPYYREQKGAGSAREQKGAGSAREQVEKLVIVFYYSNRDKIWTI